MRGIHGAVVLLLVAGVLAGGTGCTDHPGQGTSTSPTGGPATPTATATPTASRSASPSSSPSGPTVVHAVTTHGFGVPTVAVPFTTVHVVRPPIAPPPAPPLPCLRQVAVGTHPDQRQRFDQVSFRFSGGFPSYRVRYVPSLTASGSGAGVRVRGRIVLEVRFQDAQAHDERGRSSIESTPARPRFASIVDLVQVEDFEGTVVYGLGIAAVPRVSAVPGRVRIVEVEQVVAGRHLFVVAVQVATP